MVTPSASMDRHSRPASHLGPARSASHPDPARSAAPTGPPRPSSHLGPAHSTALAGLAGSVPDPELPVISLAELGVLRRVAVLEPGYVLVELTPTYTGCPAVEAMAADIERVLREKAGAERVEVRTVLSPPWSSDDISEEGRRKLAEHGIAPPRDGARASGGPVLLGLSATRHAHPGPPQHSAPRPTATPEPSARKPPAPEFATSKPLAPESSAWELSAPEPVRCPLCGSPATELLSRFSSTACKALRRCTDCREPFDHFKEV